jgi:hypothetical protein
MWSCRVCWAWALFLPLTAAEAVSAQAQAGGGDGAKAALPPPSAASAAPLDSERLSPPVNGETARKAEAALIKARLKALREQRAPGSASRELEPASVDTRANYAIGLSGDTLFRSERDRLFFGTDDSSTRFGLWAGADLLRLGDYATLGVELGVGTETSRPRDEPALTNQLEAELEGNTLLGGVSLRFALLPWLLPQLRIAGGASLFEMEIDVESDGVFVDRAVSPFGSLGAGVLLQTPPGTFTNREGNFGSLSFGMLVEGGYGIRRPIRFELKSKSESVQPIEVIGAELGELKLSGPYLRISLVTRF